MGYAHSINNAFASKQGIQPTFNIKGDPIMSNGTGQERQDLATQVAQAMAMTPAGRSTLELIAGNTIQGNTLYLLALNCWRNPASLPEKVKGATARGEWLKCVPKPWTIASRILAKQPLPKHTDVQPEPAKPGPLGIVHVVQPSQPIQPIVQTAAQAGKRNLLPVKGRPNLADAQAQDAAMQEAQPLPIQGCDLPPVSDEKPADEPAKPEPLQVAHVVPAQPVVPTLAQANAAVPPDAPRTLPPLYYDHNGKRNLLPAPMHGCLTAEEAQAREDERTPVSTIWWHKVKGIGNRDECEIQIKGDKASHRWHKTRKGKTTISEWMDGDATDKALRGFTRGRA
jgi:hypothetical protein